MIVNFLLNLFIKKEILQTCHVEILLNLQKNGKIGKNSHLNPKKGNYFDLQILEVKCLYLMSKAPRVTKKIGSLIRLENWLFDEFDIWRVGTLTSFFHLTSLYFDELGIWRVCTLTSWSFDEFILWRVGSLTSLYFDELVVWRVCTMASLYFDELAFDELTGYG